MSSLQLPMIVAGDDYPLKFTFRRKDKTPEPQTGNSLRLVIKRLKTDLDADAVVNREIAATEPDASQGVIRAPLTSAETAVMKGLGSVHVQAQLQWVDGSKRSPLLASISVVDPVFHDD